MREIWRRSGLRWFQPALASLDDAADFQREAADDDDDDDDDDEVQRATLDEAASNPIQQFSQSSRGFSPIEEERENGAEGWTTICSALRPITGFPNVTSWSC